MYNKILLPTDGSKHAEKAAEQANEDRAIKPVFRWQANQVGKCNGLGNDEEGATDP